MGHAVSGVHPNPAGALAPRSPSPSSHARAEQISENNMAVWSPRLSPDRCRIVYLENNALGPHQQCSRLRMVSSPGGHWQDTGAVAGCPCRGGGWQEGDRAPSLGCSRGRQAETL